MEAGMSAISDAAAHEHQHKILDDGAAVLYRFNGGRPCRVASMPAY